MQVRFIQDGELELTIIDATTGTSVTEMFLAGAGEIHPCEQIVYEHDRAFADIILSPGNVLEGVNAGCFEPIGDEIIVRPAPVSEARLHDGPGPISSEDGYEANPSL